MSKHTPGPWVAYANPMRSDGFFVVRDVPRALGEIPPAVVDVQLSEANARLIAAAPDLYAVCKEFVRKCESGEAHGTRNYAQMKAALQKAEGAQ